MVRIRRAEPADAALVTALAQRLWPGHGMEALHQEMLGFLQSRDAAIFLAEADGDAIGFAQAGIRRDYVQGAGTSPAGYLEGIYVSGMHRRRRVAAALVAACEEWAVEKGCTEFGSDCYLDNDESIAFHAAMGFAEASRLVCFIKPLVR